MPRAKRDKMAGELFWVDRWTGSSAFLLPWDAKGLYREMLSQAWLRGAKLPSDLALVRKITGCSDSDWDRMWPIIRPYWRVSGEFLVNDTQLEVYAASMDLRAVRSVSGKRGASTRWHPSAIPVANSKGDSKRDNKDDDKRIASGSGSGSVSTYPPTPLTEPRASISEEPQPIKPKPPSCQNHVAPMACARGVCVYPTLHRELVAKLGGDPKVAERRVKTFYTDVMAALTQDEVITEDAWVFWRRRFAEAFQKPPEPKPESWGHSYPSAEATEAYLRDLAKDAPTAEEIARRRASGGVLRRTKG